MEDRSPNMVVVRSVWRRLKKAKIRDLEIRDLEPVKDVKGGSVTGESKPTTGGGSTTGTTPAANKDKVAPPFGARNRNSK